MSRVAVIGGTGFVGGRVVDRLRAGGHEMVVGSRRTGIDLAAADPALLRRTLAGVDAVVLCAGINRELGRQTYGRVHVDGTRHVVEAARAAGVQRIVLMSFLRARPDGPSAYHRSKWVAEEIVRHSGLEATVVKAGIVYGRGDHLLDHVSRTLRTVPVFGLLARNDVWMRPVAVDDVARVLEAAALGDPALRGSTVAVVGPETLSLETVVRRIGEAVGVHPLFVPLPLAGHLVIAAAGEAVLRVPLIARAQVHILAEGVVDAAPFADPLPPELRPATPFDRAAIEAGLPVEVRGFTTRDLRWCQR